MSDASIAAESTLANASSDLNLFNEQIAGDSGVYERHEGLWIVLCVAGGGRLVRTGAQQALDGLILPGTAAIGSLDQGSEGFWPDMTVIGMGIGGARLSAVLDELSPRAFQFEAVATTFHRNELLAEVLCEMQRRGGLHGHSSTFFDHGIAIAVHQLAISAAGPSDIKGDFPLSPSELKIVDGFIDANLATDIAVQQLAALVHLSPNHFSRRFRAATGLAPYQFLTQRRLDRAAEHLVSTRLPVTQIGLLSGYANPSHFANAFRRYKGVTPLVWRRSR